MKKILFYISLVIGIALLFLFGKGNNINILAYSDIGNALGSYPIKLDIENYDKINLYDNSNTTCSFKNFNTICELDNNLVVNMNYNNSHGQLFGYSVITKDLIGLVEVGKTYTFTIFTENNIVPESIRLFSAPSTLYSNSASYVSNHLTYTFTNDNIEEHLYLGIYLDVNITEIIINNIMITEGYSIPEYYSPPFKFGYNVNYSLAVNNLTSTQVNAGIAITDSNGNYLKTGNCVIPASSSTICSNLNDPLYLPFNIDNNGYISFDYSLGLFIGPVGNLSVTPSDSGFNFVPVFNAYYKGISTNNLYFKDRYTFNNLFLSGFNVSVNSSTLSKVSFPRNLIDSEFSMNTNKIVNFATDKKIDTGIYNYINYVDFIDSRPSDIYSFVVTTGVSSPGLFNNRIYTISFSNISLRVSGDSGSVAPIPDNEDIADKYNSCSAWYDIPCQLGNAVTYVIYEAPIISPIINFFDGLIEPIKQFIRLIDQFSGFGILFGLGITAMLICIIKKMYGGGDS